MRAANVGKIGAVVDPTPAEQISEVECGEIGLRHSKYCEGIGT
jgi:hypothetical protein